jgi:hypothetical protein
MTALNKIPWLTLLALCDFAAAAAAIVGWIERDTAIEVIIAVFAIVVVLLAINAATPPEEP